MSAHYDLHSVRYALYIISLNPYTIPIIQVLI